MKSIETLNRSSISSSASREKRIQGFVMPLQKVCAQKKPSQSARSGVGLMAAVPSVVCNKKQFRCFTCDKDKNEVRFYCEVCWKRDHKGHKEEEFFCPMRCATGKK